MGDYVYLKSDSFINLPSASRKAWRKPCASLTRGNPPLVASSAPDFVKIGGILDNLVDTVSTDWFKWFYIEYLGLFVLGDTAW